MKITRFLLAFLLVLPLLQSCQNDITDLIDPRDAIAKDWEIQETQPGGQSGYIVTISKDPVEKTKVNFYNFHALKTSDNLYAIMAGSQLTIDEQVLDGTYKIKGSGTVSGDLKTITFNYTVEEGNDGVVDDVTAIFGPIYVAKKKAITAKISLQ